MFQRRIKLSSLDRIRNIVWPRSGWRRSLRYSAYRIARLPGTPHSIASGFAIGAAVAFMPIMGVHFILSAIFSMVTRSSVAASLLGTLVGNPWTFPFIWLWLYTFGNWILGLNSSVDSLHLNITVVWDFVILGVNYLGTGIILNHWNTGDQMMLEKFWYSIKEIIWPMTVGCIPTSLIIWILFYFPIYRAIVMYRNNKNNRRKRIYEKKAGKINEF